jgi:NhaP-type Na+/H+ or K+/H+ antiporter
MVSQMTYSLLTIAPSYLSYLGAERLGLSGILAAVTAGAICGLRALPRGRADVHRPKRQTGRWCKLA